jgi:hypothetical protein
MWCSEPSPISVVVWPGTRSLAPVPLRCVRHAPSINHAWVDKGYTGQAIAGAAAGAEVTVELVGGPKTGPGSTSNRDNGWLNAPTARSTTAVASTATTKQPDRARRLPLSQSIALLLRGLDRGQLFDTL